MMEKKRLARKQCWAGLIQNILLRWRREFVDVSLADRTHTRTRVNKHSNELKNVSFIDPNCTEGNSSKQTIKQTLVIVNLPTITLAR